MSDDEVISVFFVLPRGKTAETCSEDLSYAFDQSTETGVNPTWITQDKTLALTPGKKDVFVVDPFEGSAFEHVCRFKCTVVGPRCLLTCLQKGDAVPDLPYPMYTASMRNLIVTSTGFTKERKADLHKKIERMGGIYSNAFHDGVTHLIAQVVRSRKYEVAVAKEVPVMTAEWVDEVYERGKHDNIHAVDPQFSRYKCPSLMGLTVTVSQLNRKDRELLKKSIESHGGLYSGSLDMESTSLLILPKPEGDKYKYARKWKIPCVTSDWVFDSIEKGYCLSTESYRVDNLSGREKCSTPTKEDESVVKLQEVSMCSTILQPPEDTVNVNETVMPSSNQTLLNNTSGRKSVDQLLQTLDWSRVKKAGHFLQGARIFLSGFSEPHQEHLRRCLQSGGATRLNQLTGSVTHVVIHNHVPEHHRVMKELNLTPFKVTLQWVVESMLMGRPVPEEDFAYATIVMGPPQGLLKSAEKTVSVEEEETQYEDELMAQYKSSSTQDDTVQFKEEDDDTKTPVSSRTNVLLKQVDTPGDALDIEKLRPKPIKLDISADCLQNMPPDSQPSPDLKRKRVDSGEEPFYIHNMKTPETPYGAFVKANPSPATRKFFKKQCQEMGRFKLPDEVLQKKKDALEEATNTKEEDKGDWAQFSRECLEKAVESPQLKKSNEYMWNMLQERGMTVLQRENRRFSDLMEEKANKLGKSWKNPGKKIKLVAKESTTAVLDGVVLYVTKKLEATHQKEQHSIVSSLGGEFKYQYCPEVTHVVFLGKPNDLGKEFRQARADQKFIVCPDWLQMCQDEGRRMEEDIFPHTYNPKMSLTVATPGPSQQQPRRKAGLLAKTDKEAVVDKSVLNEKTLVNETKALDKSKSNKKEEDLSVHLAKMDELVDLVEASRDSSVRKSGLRMTLTSTDATPERSLSRNNSSGGVDDVNKEEFFASKTQQAQQNVESQIQWVDPQEEIERRKLAENLQRETQHVSKSMDKGQTFDSMDLPENLTEAMMGEHNVEEEEKENTPEEQSSAAIVLPKRFMMSSIANESRVSFSTFLESQGVSVSTANNCDVEATHVVAQKLNRSEKMLGSIASGKWVLHHSYMKDCIKQAKLLPEDAYEWGNPDNGFLNSLANNQEKQLASASYRWRLEISKDARKGVFRGIKAIIHTSDTRRGAFARLLELGKGTALDDARPPYNEACGATHCLAEPKKLPKVSVDYAALASQGVAVVGPVYINEFLVSDPPPPVDDYIVDEFKPYWAKRQKH